MTTRSQLDGLLDTALATYVELKAAEEEGAVSMHVKFTEAETAWKYVIPAAPKPRIRDHLGHYLHIELRPHEQRAVVVCGKCNVVLCEEEL
jgi:hypothetical protein